MATKKALKPKSKPVAGDAPTKPHSGQSGPPLDLSKDDLNPRETAVLAVLRASRAEGGVSIVDLGAAAFPSKPKAKGNSWTRNALRRLVRAKLVTKIGRGLYVKH